MSSFIKRTPPPRSGKAVASIGDLENKKQASESDLAQKAKITGQSQPSAGSPTSNSSSVAKSAIMRRMEGMKKEAAPSSKQEEAIKRVTSGGNALAGAVGRMFGGGNKDKMQKLIAAKKAAQQK